MAPPGTERSRNGTVVLVPGLGFGGLELLLLARRLRRLGWPVTIARHFPWRGSLDDKAGRLLERCRSERSGAVHLVGHSMGGLILLHALATGAMERPGRAVLLGSPLNGSAAARRVASLPLGARILGRCMNQAYRTVFPLPADREIAALAGCLNLGVGRLLGVTPPCDGVVRIDEALRDGMKDTRIVRQAHTGMLFSREVAELVDAFLYHGRFEVASHDE